MRRRAAAVDIGTNSMRLLVVEQVGEGVVELGRWQRVTGLGRGVDATGLLDPEAVDRTLVALAEFGGRMEALGVTEAAAVATSASRDASNRDEFFDRAEIALGVRPSLIDGEEEAGLAFRGATAGLRLPGPFLVVDIGGGSTELVTKEGGRSVDIGSVRLTERCMPDRPCPPHQLAAGSALAENVLAGVPTPPLIGTTLGVAGTWTSLAAIHLGLGTYDGVHLSRLSGDGLETLVGLLAGMSIAETAAIPSLDPARAPVILAGAVIALAAARRLEVAEVVISEHDLLDGLVSRLLLA